MIPSHQFFRPEFCLFSMYRYEVSAISLFGMALAVCLLQTLATSHYDIVRLLMVPVTVSFSVFCYEVSYTLLCRAEFLVIRLFSGSITFLSGLRHAKGRSLT